MTDTPHRPHEPIVLYRAALLPGYRIFMTIFISVAALFPTLALVTITSATLEARTPLWMLIGSVAALVMLIVLVGLLFLAVRGARSSFTVTTAGICIKEIFRTTDIAWADVAVIQIDQALMQRGRAVVVTRDGNRTPSSITAARFAMRRGESTYDHGPELLHPAVPVRVAIDAHQRYLRGEFTRPHPFG